MLKPMQLPMRLERAEHKRTVYFLPVAPGVPLSAVMTADYFVHVRNAIQPYDLFEAVAQDGSYEATFRCVAINRAAGTLKFRLLTKWEETASVEPVAVMKTAEARFKGAWNPGKKCHVVQEIATGDTVAEPFASLAEAKAEAERLNATLPQQVAA